MLDEKEDGPTIELCELEIATRAAFKKKKHQSVRGLSPRDDVPVIGFHFVCAREKGVTRNPDGTLWSGTWVVAEKQAEQALKTGAYVALHESKSEPSYLQGAMKGWRPAPRARRYGEQEVKITSGIDFLIEPTSQPVEWVGDGAGEKGYARESSTPGANK